MTQHAALKLSGHILRSSDKSEDATQILSISAPYLFNISSGDITFPVDLDILSPFPSTTKP